MCWYISVYLCCFRELRRQARVLVPLSLFVLFQGVESSGTCVWYTSVCLCCSRELRRQARVLVPLSLFVLFQGVDTSGTCVGTSQSVCVAVVELLRLRALVQPGSQRRLDQPGGHHVHPLQKSCEYLTTLSGV